jgi:hypothetical protein
VTPWTFIDTRVCGEGSRGGLWSIRVSAVRRSSPRAARSIDWGAAEAKARVSTGAATAAAIGAAGRAAGGAATGAGTGAGAGIAGPEKARERLTGAASTSGRSRLAAVGAETGSGVTGVRAASGAETSIVPAEQMVIQPARAGARDRPLSRIRVTRRFSESRLGATP